MSTKVYLAARYSRHPEMQEYARQLRAAGFEITSRWINGSHQVMLNGEPLGPEREAMFESNHESMEQQRREFAGHDWDDLLAADWVISFTEQPRTGGTRGGRHVEFGAALALHKRCIIVGFKENIFHCLPAVVFHKTWPEAFAWLGAETKLCEGCGERRVQSDFYPCGPDGRYRKRTCKICVRHRVRSWIDANPERHNEYSRAAYRRNPSVRRTAVARWHKDHPDAQAAHRAVQNALRRGELSRAEACQDCGRNVRLHAHHADYSRPLDVQWLCGRCHRRLEAANAA